MDDAVVQATWGLVVVTGLLVVATLIPLVSDILNRRDRKAAVAIKAIPDLNILRSRIAGTCDRLAKPAELTLPEVNDAADGVHRDLKMLTPIIKVRNASLEFTNELFIMRHLLTFAHDSLHSAEALFTKADAASIAKRTEELQTVQRAYRATLLTLDAAEGLLSKKHRTIKGERFWDRFARVSDERENEAARLIVAEDRVHRTGGPPH